MPLFTNSSPFDADVERATSELNASDDMTLLRDVCEKAKQTPSGGKDCLRSIVKRMNHKVPHVAMQALTLLDLCVRNCGYSFHIEMASRDFVSECRTFITSGKPHQKAVQKLKMLIKRWAENEFRSDSSLSIIPSMYSSLRSEGHTFPTEDVQLKETPSNLTKKEEDDIAKAIAMSLKDAEKHSAPKAQSLYPSTAGPWSSSSASASTSSRELRKVRTLYDFEAAEDNELTFKAGEIISILDDSDPNWWKGSSWRGEGLFPANFVTADLTAEPEPEVAKARKSVHFHEEVDVKILEPAAAPEVLEIDEGKIDHALALIQNADPTGEINPDPADLLTLEEQCKAMSPLIDQELEKIDRQHMLLMEYNLKLMDSFKMYNSLMSELPNYGYVTSRAPMPPPPQQQQQQPQQMHMYSAPQYASNPAPMTEAAAMVSDPQGLGYGSSMNSGAPVQSNMHNVYQSYGNQMSQTQPSFAPQPSFHYASNNGYPHQAIPAAQGQHYGGVGAGPEIQGQQGYAQMPLSAQNLL